MDDTNQIGRIAFGFIFLIVIIAIAAFIIWRFVLVHPANIHGNSCLADTDCAAGHYCSGGNVCIAGVSGGTVGAVCMTDCDCAAGLKCQSDGSTMRCTR